MGQGDLALGQKLLRSFLNELAKSNVKIDFIGCVNSGINLTTKGSEVIDALEILQQKGARIATCGTCLDFYDKRNDLMIGEIGTMDQTVKIMSEAERVISPN